MKQALLILALTPLLVGCRFGGVPAPEPWEKALRTDRVLAAELDRPPLSFRVAVAPLRVEFDPAGLFPLEPARNGSAPEPGLVRAELLEALRAAGLFQRVEARGEPGQSRKSVDAQAWEGNDDLIMEVELRSYYQEYLGHTNYLWWFLVYTWYVWPAWFVPVDLYGVGLEAHVRLRSVQRAEPLLERTYQVRPEACAQELTPNDRELAWFLDLGALWNVETSLKDSNWKAIDREVGPHARRSFLRELMRDLATEVVQPVRDDPAGSGETVLRRVRKRFGVVVGVSEYADSALGSVACARTDAERLESYWRKAGGLESGHDVAVLTDAAATREAIQEAISKIAEQVAPTDEVFVYFAGQGASLSATGDGGATPIFLPHDADTTDLRGSALGLGELGKQLNELSASRILLVFDASFSGQAGGRNYPKATAPLTGKALRLALGLRASATALFASLPGQAAKPLPEANDGLFTCVFLQGVHGGADADRDGTVTIDELWSFLEVEVPSRAGLEGFEQQPFGLGVQGATFGWPR